ncbi:MAG: 6-carboxytetrahydropterin synthase [Phycisphaerales bacterium]|nr:6-carboxytetrahydropterin synthase [Phycisphaerales bacterium]
MPSTSKMPDNPTIQLRRTVRFSVALADARRADDTARHNSFAGWPSMFGIGAYYEIEVVCRGEPDASTGYLLNISQIDQAVRISCLPVIEQAVRHRPHAHPGSVLASLLPPLQQALGTHVDSILWRLTPYYSVAMTSSDADRVSISQHFEFSASHRLHVDSLSERRNIEIFGKCNNPNSHGHNYRLQPVVSVALNSVQGQPGLTLSQIERIVDQTVIKRFDHKHLNLDTAEFAQLNPSVENITRVCYTLLAGPIAAVGGRLERVTVWETEKTSCTFPA